MWVGPRPVPEAWPALWRSMHAGWEYKLWREADLEDLPMLNRKAYEYYCAKGNWVGMCDIARQAILREHGGVYTDIDSRPLISFEGAPFMRSSFFAAYEPIATHPGRVAAGTIGSVAGHHIWDTIAKLIDDMPQIDAVWDTTGGTVLTAAALVHRQCCAPLILPAKMLFSTDFMGRPTAGRELSYCEHFWATTNHTYPMADTVILVPRRAGDEYREEAWRYARARWEALGWPVIEGHHEGADPFNASFARNNAALLAGDWNVAVFVDSDTVMFDYGPVREGVRQAAATGKFVRPYDRYYMTDETGARELMEAHLPPAGAKVLQAAEAHGGVNIIPRGLWTTLGGYDERFKGWGSEDAAIELAAKALGAFKQIKGDVYHIWHPMSADRSTGDPQFQANVALRRRYELAKSPGQMREMITERRVGPALRSVGVVMMTNGRFGQIVQTVRSLEAMVGPFSDRVICDDSGDPAYAARLREAFPAWRVMAHEHIGHGPAVVYAMEQALAMETDWVFWTEDDFEYQRPVDIAAMARVMEAEGPDLKQMVIRRQAWSPPEVAAGGMIERFDPSLFVEHASPEGAWIEHRQFFSLNPHLIQRHALQSICDLWPARPNSEHLAGLRIFAEGSTARCGLWGAKSDPPWVLHDGVRTGSGYGGPESPAPQAGSEAEPLGPMPVPNSAAWLKWNRERLRRERS